MTIAIQSGNIAMKRMNASDFHPRLLELYDGYVHGKMSKRDFLTGATRYVAAGVTAVAVLESLQPNYALASQVAEDDADIVVSDITYDSPDGHGKINGYMAAPAGATGPLPAVLVVHENRGLNPYIKDVVRRAAKAGFLAMGPDGLTPLGGYPGNDDDGRTMQKKLDSTHLACRIFMADQIFKSGKEIFHQLGAVQLLLHGPTVIIIARIATQWR